MAEASPAQLPRPAGSARGYIFLLAAVIFAIDQLTKYLVRARIPMFHSFDVVPGWLAITHTTNRGAAFSMFANARFGSIGLIAFTTIAVLVIIGMVVRHAGGFTLTAVALGLILGGAVGNLFDRIRIHEVVDFILVYHRAWSFPVFNAADSAITVGAVLLFVDLLFLAPAHPPASD